MIGEMTLLDKYGMEHFFEKISGWFSFQETYKKMIDNAANNSHFVEVGAWLGKSTAFMVVEIINSGKKVKFDVVDNWKGSPTEPWLFDHLIKETNDGVYDLFLKNMAPVLDYINPIKMDSVDAAKLYEDNSLDFVFIDAAHGYEYVKADIIAWLPKVKSGGILAGDDYRFLCGVTDAVRELLNPVEEVFAPSLQHGHDNWTFVYTKP
jgi:hypothetical protein